MKKKLSSDKTVLLSLTLHDFHSGQSMSHLPAVQVQETVLLSKISNPAHTSTLELKKGR